MKILPYTPLDKDYWSKQEQKAFDIAQKRGNKFEHYESKTMSQPTPITEVINELKILYATKEADEETRIEVLETIQVCISQLVAKLPKERQSLELAFLYGCINHKESCTDYFDAKYNQII